MTYNNSATKSKKFLEDYEAKAEFAEWMRARGADIQGCEIVADDRRHRCKAIGDKGQHKDGACWYWLRLDAEGWIGNFGNHKLGTVSEGGDGKKKSSTKGETWTPAGGNARPDIDVVEAHRRANEAKRAKEALAKERDAREAAEIARRLFDACSNLPTGYSVRKGVTLTHARSLPARDAHRIAGKKWRRARPKDGGLVDLDGRVIVVPIYRGDELVSAQIIADCGWKPILAGGGSSGAWSFAGPAIGDRPEAIVIAEGWATAETVAAASGLPVVVALDCGGLRAAAGAFRSKFQDALIIIAADNDQWTTNPPNPGLRAAEAVAAVLENVIVIAPTFVPATDGTAEAKGATDWNDIATRPDLGGTEAVRRAFADHARDVKRAPNVKPLPIDYTGKGARFTEEARAKTEAQPEPDLSHLSGVRGGHNRPRRSYAGEDEFKKCTFIMDGDRYLLPNGMEVTTRGFDQFFARYLKNIKGGGKDSTPPASKHFGTAHADRVVDCRGFDPGRDFLEIYDEEGFHTVNTFSRDFLGKPMEGDPGPYLDHMRRILPTEGDVEIVLDWMAWQVQNPGKKPHWALAIQSMPGTGKQTLAAPLRWFFGRYASTLPPTKISDKFAIGAKVNRKLFVEVTDWKPRTNSNEWDAFKPVITDDTFDGEMKFMNATDFRPCAGFFFTSNHKDAFPKDEEDRRLAVIFCKQQVRGDLEKHGMCKDSGYFARLHEWLNGGGCAVVVHMLMKRKVTIDMKGRAPSTSSEAEVIAESRGKKACLVQEWVEERCQVAPEYEERAADLFSDFDVWRDNRREDRISSTAFGSALAKLGFEKRRDKAGILRSGLRVGFPV